jgi:hypothetical protein
MMGRKPCEMASTTVARTQPLVVQPVMSTVSISTQWLPRVN